MLSRTWVFSFWVLTLAETCIRLGNRALEPFNNSEYVLTWGHYLFLILWCILMIIFGSYRGFHKQFSPRLVVRTVLGLSKSSPWWFHIPLVSPLMAAGFLHATRRRLLHSWVLLVWIIFAVIMCQLTPQPWRSFIDAGVVCRLSPRPHERHCRRAIRRRLPPIPWWRHHIRFRAIAQPPRTARVRVTWRRARAARAAAGGAPSPASGSRSTPPAQAPSRPSPPISPPPTLPRPPSRAPTTAKLPSTVVRSCCCTRSSSRRHHHRLIIIAAAIAAVNAASYSSASPAPARAAATTSGGPPPPPPPPRLRWDWCHWHGRACPACGSTLTPAVGASCSLVT